MKRFSRAVLVLHWCVTVFAAAQAPRLQASGATAGNLQLFVPAYFSTALLRAELPDTSQSGEFEAQRHYAAPCTLEFKKIDYGQDYADFGGFTFPMHLHSEANTRLMAAPSWTSITATTSLWVIACRAHMR